MPADDNAVDTSIPLLPRGILKQLHFDEINVRNVMSNLPPVQTRADAITWNSSHGAGFVSSMHVFDEMFRTIVATFCDKNEEAADAAMHAFICWKHNADTFICSNTSDQQQQTINDAKCYMALPKGSVEQRVVRAGLCHSTKRTSLQNLHQSIPNFTMSNHSFESGLHDFKLLVAGTLLEKATGACDATVRMLLDMLCHSCCHLTKHCFCPGGPKFYM
jgi:hypothetical protein